MFSYRHAFHAGNHADVLKHVVLVQLLQHLVRKDKPLLYVDTHAGPLTHSLGSAEARKNGEFETGIARVWGAKALPEGLAEYRDQVRALNPDGSLRQYPGSAGLAMQVLRPADRLRLFELHPTEGRQLAVACKPLAPRVIAQPSDGFDGLKASFPPPTRRGIALIDPPYEDKRDYGRVVAALRDALSRFATGVYAVWYPLVQRREAEQFAERLRQLQKKDWLHASLRVKAPSEDGLGLYGSGMVVINPPHTLPAVLGKALPWMARELAQDPAAQFQLEHQLT